MKTKTIEVMSKIDGQKVPAQLMICEECGGECFILFILEGHHQHIQCTQCDHTYCDQTCATVGREN